VIEEQARVAAVEQGLAQLVVEKQTACGTCAVKSGCGTSLLSTWLPKRQLVFRVKNDIGARPGDRVMLGLDEDVLQRSSILLYALPLAGLLLGAVAGEAAFPVVGLPAELGAVLTGLFGVTAALTYVRYRSVTLLGANNGGVRLLRVVSDSTAFAPGDIVMPNADQS
jgi:sigma-E factor negative regulatory protein RseC